MLKKLDQRLGEFWDRFDRVIFADYPTLDRLLFSNWFVPTILAACVIAAITIAIIGQ